MLHALDDFSAAVESLVLMLREARLDAFLMPDPDLLSTS
jgi:hypothetical protein